MRSRNVQSASRISLRVDALERVMTDNEIAGIVPLADVLGVHRTTVWRVMEGQQRPGTPFIAACVSRLGVRFEDLFTIDDTAGAA